MLIIWTEHVTNEVLRIIERKRIFMLRIRMRELTFLGFILRKENSESLIPTDKY